MRTVQRFFIAGTIAGMIGLAGCGKPTSAVESDLATAQQQVKDLTARVDTLEAKVQALEATLPVDAAPDTDPSGSDAS